MVSNIPGMDLAALSDYANRHGISYGQLVARIGPAETRAIVENYVKNRDTIHAEKRKQTMDRLAEKLDKDQAIQYWRQGCSDLEIAELCGVAAETVRRWRVDNGLRKMTKQDKEERKRQEILKELETVLPKDQAKRKEGHIDDDRAMYLYEKGFSDYAIADVMRVTPDSVNKWRQKRGLVSQWVRKSQERKQTMLDMYAKGVSIAEIRKQMGVSDQWVRTVIREDQQKKEAQQDKQTE